jgi:hypothetical protein
MTPRPSSAWSTLLRSTLVVTSAALVVACSDSKTPVGAGDTGTTTSTRADAAAPDTGARATDLGVADLGVSADLGVNADSGASSPDASIPTGMLCMELVGCCGELPANLQGTCDNAANGGDETRCGQILDIARNQLGACLPAGFDAGPTPDAVALGPVCSELAACCPQTGQLQGLCSGAAGRGNEGACGTILRLAQGRGLCTPMGADAGVEDTGPLPDAGTSTTGLDAGTSTVGVDAG